MEQIIVYRCNVITAYCYLKKHNLFIVSCPNFVSKENCTRQAINMDPYNASSSFLKMCTSNIWEWIEVSKSMGPFEVRFLGALKWHLCNLGQALDRRLKLRTALHGGAEGQLSKRHGEPRELIALHAHVATVRDKILTASSCGNGASLSAEGKWSLQWTHTTHFCCLQTLTDSTQQSEGRQREKRGVSERETETRSWNDKTSMLVCICFFLSHTLISLMQGKTLFTESISRLTWLYNVARM